MLALVLPFPKHLQTLQTVVQAIAKLFEMMNNTVYHWPAKSLLRCSEESGMEASWQLNICISFKQANIALSGITKTVLSPTEG